MEHPLMILLPGNEPVSKNGLEDNPPNETFVADASGWAFHTESCPGDCYSFVSRYLLGRRTLRLGHPRPQMSRRPPTVPLLIF